MDIVAKVCKQLNLVPQAGLGLRLISRGVVRDETNLNRYYILPSNDTRDLNLGYALTRQAERANQPQLEFAKLPVSYCHRYSEAEQYS